MANLSLRHVKKVYDGNVVAVQDFNLEIADKEFIVLVGPPDAENPLLCGWWLAWRRSPKGRSTSTTSW